MNAPWDRCYEPGARGRTWDERPFSPQASTWPQP
jgi:hypothetical protein